MRRHIVVVALVVAGISCAHAGPASFPGEPHGFAASLFQHSTPAILTLGHFGAAPSPVRPVAQQGPRTEQLRRKAEELYKATSRDAETFEAALLIPEIRLKIERALHQKVSDQMLRRLADQARSEAIFWYQYMQGLEK
jgi:hypothetical protein